MAWTIPDDGEGANVIQSIVFQEYLDVLVAGVSGVDCVLSGCAVTAQGSPDMTCAVASGTALSNGIQRSVSGGNVTFGTADATNPRIDLVVVDSSGTKAVRAGTAAEWPKPPTRTANDVVLAAVLVLAGGTTIATNQIVDLRVLREYLINLPVSDDGAALGSTSLKWSDLFLASGAVLNFNNGNVTVTHAAGVLTVAGGGVKLAAGTTTLAPLQLQSGTNLTTQLAGAVEFDGKRFMGTAVVGDRGVIPTELFRVLLSDATGSDTASAQPWFPSNGAVAVQGSTCYRFQGAFSSRRTAGSTSHTTGISFGGTATITAIGYHVEVKEGDAATISDSDLIAIQTASDTNIKAASTSTTENIVLMVWGHVWINAGGTLIPQFKYSAAPGGAPTIEVGTYFRLAPIGDNAITSMGTWS